MGVFNNLKAFVHSITTDDHYASYDSPYRNSVINNNNLVGDGSHTRLNELNNESAVSLNDPNNQGKSSVFINYRPGMRSSNTNLNGSDLQLQNLNREGQPPLPSIDSLLDRLEAWLEEEYPELGDNLNDGVTSADLNEFENDLGCGGLPVEFRQFYKRHDGQLRHGKPTGLFMGLKFLDLEGIIEEHDIWIRVAERVEKQKYLIQQSQKDSGPEQEGNSSNNDFKLNNSFINNQKSIPPNSIQPSYSHKGWIPLFKDDMGNQIALDVSPGPQGSWGQVIVFGREFDTKLVVALNLQEFLFNYINDLENGNFKIDQTDIDTSYGFLESSRNDVGDEDEGQGDLIFWDKDKEFGKITVPLTYLEVLKRRTLKKYGVSDVDNFLTSFVPQMVPIMKKVARAESPLANSTKEGANDLIDVNASKVSLPKETIIDDKLTDKPDSKLAEDSAAPEQVEQAQQPSDQAETQL